MAIYSFNSTIIKRSKGMSVVKAAANMSAEKLYDARLDETFNFVSKQNSIINKGIIAPSKSPYWMKDREKLWNYVELCEKRTDAQLARKFGIALPNELTEKVNIELSKVFINQQLISEGMLADFCIFYTKKEVDPYLTILTTMRKITDNGFGKKEREWDKRPLHLKWREEWANILNIYLHRNGHGNQKVTHKSLASQGLELLPQGKSAPIESRERLTDLVDKEEAKIKVNEKIILKNPDALLLAISKQYDKFGEDVIDGFIRRNSLSEESFAQIKILVMKSPSLVVLNDPWSKAKKGSERYCVKIGSS